jgi:hypothetical protein
MLREGRDLYKCIICMRALLIQLSSDSAFIIPKGTDPIISFYLGAQRAIY